MLKNFLSNFTPEFKEMFLDVLQTIGILSLSENHDHPLLWSHYAASHKGFAIEFNANHGFFNKRRSNNDELFHLRKVKYVKELDSTRALSQMKSDDILSTKEVSWNYESEWRMLAPLKDADFIIDGTEKIHLFSLPLSSISSVILGAQTRPEIIHEIESIIKSHDDFSHIELKRAEIDQLNRRIQIHSF